MKKHHAKKSLSLFLALLMLITAVPLTAVPAAAAGGTIGVTDRTLVSSSGRYDSTWFTVCSDGESGNTSIGFLTFNISNINKNSIVDAKLNLTATVGGDYNGITFLEMFSVDPSKRPDVIGQTNTIFREIFGTDFTSNRQVAANSAKKYLGVTGQPAVAVIGATEISKAGGTKTYSIDISEEVNNARKNNENELCFAFLNPMSYHGSKQVWSDIKINHQTANITYAEPGSTKVPFSAAVTLYKSTNNPRGTAYKQTICSDGSNTNTTAAFVTFDISSVPSSVSNVSFVTSAWRAGSSNTKVTADIYSIDPTKAPGMSAGTGTQTTQYFDEAFGTRTPNITSAKSYFGATTSLGQIKTSDLSSSASVITRDITSAVKEAKAARKTELCLMIINPTNYSGSDSNGWSDIYFNPQQTKLVCSEDQNTNGYGSFDSGIYYVKIVINCNNQTWNNYNNQTWLRLMYKPTNGTETEKMLDLAFEPGTFAQNGTKTFEYALNGFPSGFWISVASKPSNQSVWWDPAEVWIGSAMGSYSQKLNVTGIGGGKIAAQGQDDIQRIFNDTPNSDYPYAKTFDWKTSPAETFVPYIGSNSVSAAVVAKDQYGVVMGTEYTATIKKFAKDNTISPIASTGLSASRSNIGDLTAIVADSAKVENTDYFYGRLTVNVADANTSQIGKNSKDFKIVNQKETVTLDSNGGELSHSDYQIYYGSPLNAEINRTLNGYAYPPTGTREGYTLKGIYSSATGTNKIEDNDKVLSNATYHAQWQANLYTVTFLDANGNTYYEQSVEYGKSATAPINPPKKAYDADNHYDFTGWNTDFSNVKDNLTVKPEYTTVPHNMIHDSSKDTEAKCEQDGKVYYACSCGYSEYREGQKAPGHNWKENGRVSATCENDGYVSYICETCFETKKEVLSATGHSYVETVITPATCESTGLKKYICSAKGCGKTDPNNGGDEGVVVDALGHDWKEWEVMTEATCDSDGLRRRLCRRDKCQYKTKYYTEVIKKSGHNWLEEIFTEGSTCTAAGRTYKKCLNDKCIATLTVDTLPLAPHTLGEWTTEVEPTCVQNGSEVQICSVCKKVINRAELTATGHDYQNYSKVFDATCTEPAKETGSCTRCSATDTRYVEGSKALGHEFKNYNSDNNAGCETNETKTAKCTRCTVTDTVEIKNSALGHEFKNYKSDNNATCESDGTKTAKCERCSKTKTVDDVGSKKAHSIKEYAYNDDATCTSDGTKTGRCSVCGHDITVTAEGTKLPHDFVDYVLKTEATCLEDAKEEGTCSVCGAKDVRTVEGTKGQHRFPDSETEADKYTSNNDSTCKQHGTKSAYCTVCGKAKKTIEDPDSELEHRIVYWISDGNATCTANGTKHGTCAYCGEYSESGVEEEDSALGHWFRDYKYNNDASCEKDGTRTATCEREGCDATENVTAKNTALGHDWSEWAFVEGQAKVDCTTGGKQERHCLRTGCTANEDRDVAALGHTWAWVTVKEDGENTDCTKGYYKIKECSVCHVQDENSKVEVAGGAHNFVVSEYVEPTCTTAGKRVVSCSVCKTVYSSETLAATGHINYSLDEKTVKAPTCLEEGYTGDYICDLCGEVAKAGEAIPVSSEHVYTTYITTTPATCTANAIETARCSVCGEYPITREVPASALGHTFSNYVLDGNATCTGIATKTAKCDRCDATDTVKVYGTALGHDWSEWVTTKEATCAEKGEAEKHCKRENCGVSVTKELRKLSHTEGDWITDKEPTCTETGHRYKECVGGCGTVLTEETIKAKGHSYEVSENTATCIDDGFLTYKCTVCGDTKNGGIVHALGHERGEWEIIKAPTCTKEGKKQARCTVCGTILATEVIEVTDHVDNDGDGYCDECSKDMGDPDYNGDCGCICHKKHPLMKFLYTILRFFWKIFHIRKTCYCKVIHY